MSQSRRTALKLFSGVLGGGAAASVAGPMLRAVFDSVGATTVTGTGSFVAVTDLEAIPDDGAPVNVPVVVDAPIDGWTRMPPTQVGSVWLGREGDRVFAFSTVCPHLGCGIDWETARRRFICPCHDSYFDPDGAVQSGPSPRGMDALEVRVVEGRVEVKFEKFALGTADKRTV